MKRLVLTFLLCWSAILLADPPYWLYVTASGTDGSCQFYNPNGDSAWAAERFNAYVGWALCVNHIAYAKEHGLNAAQGIFLYLSVTDMAPYINASDSGWEAGYKSHWVRNRVVELGGSVEDCYLHFYDSTIIVDSGDTLFVGGTGSLTITAADSVNRAPNSYVTAATNAGITYGSTFRAAPNLANEYLRQALKEYAASAFDTSYDGAREVHWGARSFLDGGTPALTDGLMLDNASYRGMTGATQCVYGGLVVETRFVRDDSSHADTDSLYAFAQNDFHHWGWCWYWQKYMYRVIRDTLKIADQWSPDSATKRLIGNIGEQNWAGTVDSLTPWNASVGAQLYPDSCGLDGVLNEIGYDPVRRNNLSIYNPAVLHTRDSARAANGGTSYWLPAAAFNTATQWTDEEWWHILFMNYAFFLTFKADSSFYDTYKSYAGVYGLFYKSDFDSLRWPPALDTPLGQAETRWALVDSNDSPDWGGCYYKVYSRGYVNGDSVLLTLARPKDCFSGQYGDDAVVGGDSVTIDLEGWWYRLNYDGTWDADSITSVDIYAAESMILITTASLLPPPPSPSDPKLLLRSN